MPADDQIKSLRERRDDLINIGLAILFSVIGYSVQVVTHKLVIIHIFCP
jgi:hypothetical protein